MSAFYSALGNAISSIISFLKNFSLGIAQILKTIPQAFVFLFNAFTALPPVLLIFALTFISVSIVYLIVGR